MEASRIGVKLFLANPHVYIEDVVGVFHSWIQQQALPGNLLIDVADYLHVPEGPGVVLVGHEANFAMDQAGGRPGLLYQRKRPTEGTFGQKLAGAFGEALRAAWLLEQDPKLAGGWQFDLREMRLRITDQLAAPNAPATLEKLRPALMEFFAPLVGGVKLDRVGDARACFELKVDAPRPEGVETLLARLQN